VTTPEEVFAGIPADISRAYDRLVADGVPIDRAADMAVAMKQLHATGKVARSLEQQVDHFLDLRKSLRR
jgi:DNA-binding MltR family transcriptional regulator